VHFAQRQQQSANTQRALQAQLQALDAELADAQAKRAAAPYEDPQEFVKSYDTTQHWCNHATSRSQQFESDLRDIETRLDSSYAELQRLATHVTGPVLTQTEIVERRQRLAAHMNAVELYRSSRTVHSTYADMLGALWRRKTTAEARVQEAAKRNERLGVAERVAETFHWDKLPKLIAQRNLQLLIEDVNVNLQDFQAPFRVQASSDLSFAVSFPDRNLLEAVQLSGGQQVMLSLAFRLSLDRIFGSSIGLLCFDEPSAGLDVRNQQIFYETLRTIVGRTAEPRQVIVVTHTAGLGQFFDRRIELDDASVELLSVA
jgi:DNA repair exonuclease SbcCD ATPase subunit